MKYQIKYFRISDEQNLAFDLKHKKLPVISFFFNPYGIKSKIVILGDVSQDNKPPEF